MRLAVQYNPKTTGDVSRLWRKYMSRLILAASLLFVAAAIVVVTTSQSSVSHIVVASRGTNGLSILLAQSDNSGMKGEHTFEFQIVQEPTPELRVNWIKDSSTSIVCPDFGYSVDSANVTFTGITDRNDNRVRFELKASEGQPYVVSDTATNRSCYVKLLYGYLYAGLPQ